LLRCGILTRLLTGSGQPRASQPRPRGVCLLFKTLRRRGHGGAALACQQPKSSATASSVRRAFANGTLDSDLGGSIFRRNLIRTCKFCLRMRGRGRPLNLNDRPASAPPLSENAPHNWEEHHARSCTGVHRLRPCIHRKRNSLRHSRTGAWHWRLAPPLTRKPCCKRRSPPSRPTRPNLSIRSTPVKMVSCKAISIRSALISAMVSSLPSPSPTGCGYCTPSAATGQPSPAQLPSAQAFSKREPAWRTHKRCNSHSFVELQISLQGLLQPSLLVMNYYHEASPGITAACGSTQ